MRILLTAVGTRGDVDPILALALEVRRRGHDVRLCVSPNFVDEAKNLDLSAVAMGVEMRAPAGPAPRLDAASLRQIAKTLPDLITDQFETVGAAAADCDAILNGNAHHYAGPSIAEQRKIPCITAVYAPVTLPSGSHDDAGWGDTRRRWNERALERVNANRARLGMSPIEDVLDYVLTARPWLAADPVLGPAPDTATLEVVQTGAWIRPDERPLPPDLERFLKQGEPPVFVGFGSMPAARDVGAIVAAVRGLGRRLVLSQGWAALEITEPGPDALVIGEVNFALLFQRVAAVVHHGGAGTTTTAARAGVPQVVTSMFGDQFYWGSRVAALGIGDTLPHAEVTADTLTTALRRALDEQTRDRARALAPRIVRDGAQVAAERLLEVAAGSRPHAG